MNHETSEIVKTRLNRAMKIIARVAKSLRMTVSTQYDFEYEYIDGQTGAITFDDSIYLCPDWDTINNRIPTYNVLLITNHPGSFNPVSGYVRAPETSENEIGINLPLQEAIKVIFKQLVDMNFDLIYMAAQDEVDNNEDE